MASSSPAIVARACHKHTVPGVRASKPGASFSSQSGSPQPWPSAMGGTGCLQQEEIGDQPSGQDVGCGSLQKEAPWAPWNQKFLVLERPTFWALVSQAESRLRPKSWPGSLGDPVTFPKGGVSGRGQVVPVFIPASILLPTWGRADGLFQRWKPWGALIVPSAKPSKRPRGAFSATH